MTSSRIPPSLARLRALARPCAALATVLASALASCGAPEHEAVPPVVIDLPHADDPDGAVVYWHAAVENAPTPQAREAARAKLEEARARAIGLHVDAGHQAFAAHDLAAAESQYHKAAALRADDPRVVAGQTATADVRARAAQTLTGARVRLTALTNHHATLADRAEWHALIKDLEWLALWPRDFAEGATLWRDAQGPVAAFLVLDAQDLLAAGKPQEAEARAQKALAWSPGHPEAVALMEKLHAVNDFQQQLIQAESDLQAGRLEQALGAFEALAARPNPPAEALTGLGETKKRLVADLLLRAKDQRASKNWPLAMRLAGRAKSLATDDAALTKESARVFVETHEKILAGLQKSLGLALKQKLPAAALLYAQFILAVSPDDKAARKVRAKWAGKVAAMASTRLAILADGAAVEGQAPGGRGHKGHAAAQTEAPPVPGLSDALIAGVRRGLAAAGLEQAGVAIVTDKKTKADARLLLTVTNAKLERTQAPEPRSKNYLDHVEIVDNPAWTEAQARQSSALLALNVATQELRPVQEGLNEADRELFNLQTQLAEIRKKIVEEDTAYYVAIPSPCPDGLLQCAGTRANVRWRANVEYYEKQIQKQQAHLAEMAPKRVKLQAAVDEKQVAYDAAQKVAADTPKRAPKEIWLPYDYQVQHQTYAAEATLQSRLEVSAPAVKAPGKSRHVDAAAPFEARSQWQQSGVDFATGVVEVKGQILEPNHPSALPSDATVVNQLADHLLAPVLPAVTAAIGAHGERFVKAAAAAKDALAKLDQLALAWLTAPGLPEAMREQVRSQLVALTAWLPPPGRLDGGTILYDKLPALK